MALTKFRLGDLITLSEEKNSDNRYAIDDVKGASIRKVFIEIKLSQSAVLYKVLDVYCFLPELQSGNGDKLCRTRLFNC